MAESEVAPPDGLDVPGGPATRDAVMGGIRRLAYHASSETVSLRAWELLGRDIGMFKDAPGDGGAPVVRMTPPLDPEPSDRLDQGAHRDPAR